MKMFVPKIIRLGSNNSAMALQELTSAFSSTLDSGNVVVFYLLSYLLCFIS